jgi:hypothetical protein
MFDDVAHPTKKGGSADPKRWLGKWGSLIAGLRPSAAGSGTIASSAGEPER